MADVAVQGIPGYGAVVDGAVAAAGQRADIGGTHGQQARQRHRAGLPGGEQHDVAQGALVQAEQAGIAAAGLAGKGRGLDGVLPTVVGVGEGMGVAAADGPLLCDRREPGGGPAIGAVVHRALLLEGGTTVQTGRVRVVVQAQVIEMPRRADAHLGGRAGHGAALGYRADKVGIVIIGDVIHLHRAIEGRGYLSGVDQLVRQRQQPVAAAHVDGLDGVELGVVGHAAQRIPKGHGLRGLGVEHHAVAVDGHVAGGLQGGAVGAQEAVGAVAVPLVIGQRAGFEFRLPVAVVGQAGEPGIGVGAETHVGHQVVCLGVAGLGGEGAAQGGDAVGTVLAAPGLAVDVGGAAEVIAPAGQVVHAPQHGHAAVGGGHAGGSPRRSSR